MTSDASPPSPDNTPSESPRDAAGADDSHPQTGSAAETGSGPETGSKRYRSSVDLPATPTEAFAYHERPGALQRLIPPFENVRVESSDGSLHPGSRVVLKQSLAGIPLRWIAEHTRYDPPRMFADTQKSGPFDHWLHHHRFESLGETDSRMTDAIDYRLPAGSLGRILGGGLVESKLESMFAYRHRITRDDLTLGRQHALPTTRIAISGSSGLVGGTLDSLCSLLGHRPMSIVRDDPSDRSLGDDEIAVWCDEGQWANQARKLEGVDAVVHLAGKNIASNRWSDSVKKEIRDSRVIKTRQLCERLAQIDDPPKTLICASATGIYGDRGDEILSEDSVHGDDFLAEVAEQWEAACTPAKDAGIRVVHARFGLILWPTDGALSKSLLPAKLMGGRLGAGDQWWSWIALDDVVGAIYHALATDTIEGPVNFVAPQPVRQSDFAITLGRVLSRPALIPAPAFGLRLALGEMADALLLSSTRASSAKLQSSGYRFRFRDLESAFRYMLGKNRKESVA